MPFGVAKRKHKWVVINKKTKKIYGTHDTKEKALMQLKAIKSNYYKENATPIYESSELLFSLSKKYNIPLEDLENLWKRATSEYEEKLKNEDKPIDKSKQSFWNGVLQELKKMIQEFHLEEAKIIMSTKEKYKESLSKWLDCIQTDNYVEAQKIFPDVIKYKTQLLLNKKKNLFLRNLSKSKNTN